MTTNPFLPPGPPALGGLLPDSQAKLFLRSVAFHHISLAFLELISIKIQQEKGGSPQKVPSCRPSSQTSRADPAAAPTYPAGCSRVLLYLHSIRHNKRFQNLPRVDL